MVSKHDNTLLLVRASSDLRRMLEMTVSPDLVDLSLHGVSLIRVETLFTFPHLHTLTLDCVRFVSSTFVALLAPTTLPALRVLAVAGNGDPGALFGTVSSALLPQFEVLQLHLDDLELLPPLLNDRVTTLFTISRPQQAIALPSPSSLHHLRCTFTQCARKGIGHTSTRRTRLPRTVLARSQEPRFDGASFCPRSCSGSTPPPRRM